MSININMSEEDFKQLHMCNFDTIKPKTSNTIMREIQAVGRALRKRDVDWDQCSTTASPPGGGMSFEELSKYISENCVRDYVQQTAKENMVDSYTSIAGVRLTQQWRNCYRVNIIKPRNTQSVINLTLDQITF